MRWIFQRGFRLFFRDRGKCARTSSEHTKSEREKAMWQQTTWTYTFHWNKWIKFYEKLSKWNLFISAVLLPLLLLYFSSPIAFKYFLWLPQTLVIHKLPFFLWSSCHIAPPLVYAPIRIFVVVIGLYQQMRAFEPFAQTIQTVSRLEPTELKPNIESELNIAKHRYADEHRCSNKRHLFWLKWNNQMK